MGIFIGIQFFLWTAGGLYFSWNNLDEIHGDHLLTEAPEVNDFKQLSPIQPIVDQLISQQGLESLSAIRIISILDHLHYQIIFKDSENNIRYQLANASSGELRGPISEKEALTMASQRIAGDLEVSSVEFLESTGPHHEYREKPLPAWAITFDSQDAPTIYISSVQGTMQSIRHQRWRIFDFLWMLHTMDYESRDHFGNVLLKTFSLLGLATIGSGFLLYFSSSPTFRKIRKKKTKRSEIEIKLPLKHIQNL